MTARPLIDAKQARIGTSARHLHHHRPDRTRAWKGHRKGLRQGGPSGEVRTQRFYDVYWRKVAGRRKRTVLLLVTVLLAGGGLLAVSAPSAKNSGEAEQLRLETKPLFAKDSDFSEQRSNSVTSPELFLKMMLSVLLVVVLGVAAVYISRKVLPRINNLPGKEICILETAHLGPRKAVHLVKVGSQRLLIGSTSESITTLANVTDALTDLPVSNVNAFERT